MPGVCHKLKWSPEELPGAPAARRPKKLAYTIHPWTFRKEKDDAGHAHTAAQPRPPNSAYADKGSGGLFTAVARPRRTPRPASPSNAQAQLMDVSPSHGVGGGLKH